MNIISQFNKFVEKSFNKFLKNYFYQSNYWNKSSSINNYIDFMTDLDNFNYSFMTNVIKMYLEYIDDVFFHSSYRKNFCISKGFYNRTILTLFGEVTYKRRYYYDKRFNDRFFFTDLFLNLPKRKYFDPFVCAKICKKASETSYSKSGKYVSEIIGHKINNIFKISRASARNIVMKFNIVEDNNKEEIKRVERLYVMLDEKFVASQFNEGLDHMIKAAVCFENRELVYKYKKKEKSQNRIKLTGTHTCASIDNNLLYDVVDYIYNNYDIDYLNEINFMGDCALWIKNFPKSYWFKFNKDTIVNFSMDNFHFSQALQNLTTEEHKDVYKALYEYVLHDDKNNFIDMCNDFIELNPLRQETIENKMNYILNNWNERQFYQNHSYMKCSMESHISHIFADLFTSRPKAYSKTGLNQLLKLRLLKINNIDIEKKYLDSLKYTASNTNNKTIFNKSIYNTDCYYNSIINTINKDNNKLISFI